MFVVSCLLAARLTILKIFCQFTSLWIRYMYSQITFTTMFKFSNWNHISNEGPILAIARHIGNICPNLDNLLWSRSNTVLGFIDRTSPDAGSTHSGSLVLPWGTSPGPLQLETPWVSGTYQIHLSADAELLNRLCLTSLYAVSTISWRSLTNSE